MQIVVRQISGLGNQLFQYAAGRYFANKYRSHLRIAIDPPQRAFSHGYPRPFLLTEYQIDAPFAPPTGFDRAVLATRQPFSILGSAARRLFRIQTFAEKLEERYKFHPELNIHRDTRTVYLVGYWQAYKFAAAVEQELRSELQFSHPATGINLEIQNRIKDDPESVSLHLRRGDYTLAAEGNIALDFAYYERSIQHMLERLTEPTFYIFSDDMEFARQVVPRHLRAVFVDHNDARTAHEDMRLMSSCRNHILANSSFSWWGAWLNPRSDKLVTVPKYWLLTPDSFFPDLVPPGWTILDNRRA